MKKKTSPHFQNSSCISEPTEQNFIRTSFCLIVNMIQKYGCIRSIWPGFSIQLSVTHGCGATAVRRACRQEAAAKLRAATYRRHARHALTAGLRDRDTQACYTETKGLTGSWLSGAPSPCWVLWRHRQWSWRDTHRCSLSRGFWVCRSGRLPRSQAYRHTLSWFLVKSKLHWCHIHSESKRLKDKHQHSHET